MSRSFCFRETEFVKDLSNASFSAFPCAYFSFSISSSSESWSSSAPSLCSCCFVSSSKLLKFATSFSLSSRSILSFSFSCWVSSNFFSNFSIKSALFRSFAALCSISKENLSEMINFSFNMLFSRSLSRMTNSRLFCSWEQSAFSLRSWPITSSRFSRTESNDWSLYSSSQQMLPLFSSSLTTRFTSFSREFLSSSIIFIAHLQLSRSCFSELHSCCKSCFSWDSIPNFFWRSLILSSFARTSPDNTCLSFKSFIKGLSELLSFLSSFWDSLLANCASMNPSLADNSSMRLSFSFIIISVDISCFPFCSKSCCWHLWTTSISFLLDSEAERKASSSFFLSFLCSTIILCNLVTESVNSSISASLPVNSAWRRWISFSFRSFSSTLMVIKFSDDSLIIAICFSFSSITLSRVRFELSLSSFFSSISSDKIAFNLANSCSRALTVSLFDFSSSSICISLSRSLPWYECKTSLPWALDFFASSSQILNLVTSASFARNLLSVDFSAEARISSLVAISSSRERLSSEISLFWTRIVFS